MNKILTFLLNTSFCLFLIVNQSIAQNDSLVYNERYGASFGVDLFKFSRTAFDDNYTGFEVNADYRFTDEIYLAAELGNDQFTFDESNLVVDSDGSYIKLGANYNFYKNWIGMQNQIYAGFRIGLSSYSQTLKEFNLFTTDNTFEPETQILSREFNNLSAVWTEFQFGFEVELFKNVYAGAHIQIKFLVNETELQNFDNIFIPGFNITNDFSSIGAGWGYSLSYLIPLKTKRKTQSVNPK